MVRVKTADEIEKMRAACRITRDALQLVKDHIRAGMTTLELNDLVHDYIISCGARPNFLGLYGFPYTVCASVDDVVVHGFPSDTQYIKEGQIVSIDLGAEIYGYNGDAARSFCIGKTDPEKQRLVEVTRQCFFEGIKGIGPGSALGDIGFQIQSYAEANGFSVVREMMGHGIGRRLHEEPDVRNYGNKGTGIRLRAGMTLAIEPMINMGTYDVIIDGWKCVTKDGKPSAHYENTVLITDDGVEILTL